MLSTTAQGSFWQLVDDDAGSFDRSIWEDPFEAVSMLHHPYGVIAAGNGIVCI